MSYFVTVRPNGTIMGPVGEDADYVKKCLIYGYSRSTKRVFKDEDELWARIQSLGYRIKECDIILNSGKPRFGLVGSWFRDRKGAPESIADPPMAKWPDGEEFDYTP